MASQVISQLKPEHGKVFLDLTFGGGGHSRRLLASNKSITIIAVDRDPVAIEKANLLAKEICIKSEKMNIEQRLIPIHAKFSTVWNKIALAGFHHKSINGIFIDLGASSMQYDDPNRGFSLSKDSKLDMRMDQSDDSCITAEDVVNNLDVDSLKEIFKTYGQETKAIKVANAILDARTVMGRIKTTQELARIILTARGSSIDSIGRFAHPGTKIFQSLRIFVNNELNELNYCLKKMKDYLVPEVGVAAILTFHSLEDKIVKKHFNDLDPSEPDFKRLSQHDRIQTRFGDEIKETPNEKDGRIDKWQALDDIIKPTFEEVALNPRARSAKLRVAIKKSIQHLDA